MPGDNLLMKNRILVSNELFDKFYSIVRELKYGVVADIMHRLHTTVSQTEGGLLMAPVFLEEACTIIANNVVYAQCAQVVVPMSNLLQAHYAKAETKAVGVVPDPKQKPEPELINDSEN